MGINVLDDAVNETAAYVAEKSQCYRPVAFGMFHRSTDKAASLSALSSLQLSPNIFFRGTVDFRALPDRPLCYWVSPFFLNALRLMEPFGSRTASVQMGLAPRDEFRFSRLWWEVEAGGAGAAQKWFPYAKGGELSPYYSDVELMLNGLHGLREIKAALDQKYPYLKGNLDWVLHPENDYFEAGLTFGQRTSHLRVSVLPSKCYFSVAGKAIFGRRVSSSALLQAVNTPSAQYLVSLRRESFEMNPQFQEGDVSRMPWPTFEQEVESELEELGHRSVRAVRAVASIDEIDHAFIFPFLDSKLESPAQVARELLLKNEKKADSLMAPLLSLAPQDLWFLESEVTPRWSIRSIANWFQPLPSRDCLLYALGTAFGRWDIRYATGERQPPELPDPFDPLPVCPPGMLQNTEGLPAKPKDVPANYPLRISWPGILVDDENHPEDVVARVREAIAVIWKDRAEAIEQEACGILDVSTLRDYFRRPGAFFADHLKRYSKSRRQAPIYWPLSSGNGSYSVWLYYHRFTADTLYRVLDKFVEPRIQEAEREQFSLESQGALSGEAATRLQEVQSLLQDLRLLKKELDLVAPLWNPNLNDGVIINHALLWRITPHTPWQKKCKECWDKLVKGGYDWAHLAFNLWPERVIRKCTTDRSLAIAHGLEERLWQETQSGNWLTRQVSEAQG